MIVTASRKSVMTSIFRCGDSFYYYGFLKVAAPCGTLCVGSHPAWLEVPVKGRA